MYKMINGYQSYMQDARLTICVQKFSSNPVTCACLTCTLKEKMSEEHYGMKCSCKWSEVDFLIKRMFFNKAIKSTQQKDSSLFS